jgi:hypothetical protein
MTRAGWDGAAMPRKHPHGPMPGWLAREVRGADEPGWLAAMGAQKVDGERMLTELEEAAAQIDERRERAARRREAERQAGAEAWERAMTERYGRLPVAASASSSWWGGGLPVRIW